MKCKVNVVELSNEFEKERGDIFSPLRLDFGGEKSFHARQREETKKLEEGITRVLGSSTISSPVVPILTVWQSRETFFVYFFGKESVLLSMGIIKIWGRKKVLTIYSFHDDILCVSKTASSDILIFIYVERVNYIFNFKFRQIIRKEHIFNFLK